MSKFEIEKAWLNSMRKCANENWSKGYYAGLTEDIENRMKEELECPPLTLDEFGELENQKVDLLNYLRSKITERENLHTHERY